MLIDWHCHWTPPELSETLRRRTHPPRIETREDGDWLILPDEELSYGPEYEDLKARIAAARPLGVGKQVISLPSLFGIDALPLGDAVPMTRAFNDGVAAQSKASPTAISGIAALPLADLDASLEELDRVAALGLVGVILPDEGFSTYAQTRRMLPLLSRAQSNDMHIFVHPGSLPGSPKGPPRPEDLDNANQRHISLAVQAGLSEATMTLTMTPLLEELPKLRVQVANLGGSFPFLVERIATVAHRRGLQPPDPQRFAGRLTFDTASFGPHAIAMARKAFGASSVVFGSDSPVFELAEAARAFTRDSP